MNLESLEKLLGVNLMSCGKTEVISADRWHLVNERLDPVGATRLMLAAGRGSLGCVELLLRCGAEVDARDRGGRKAIDYSIDGDRHGTTLLLLRFDSLLPEDSERRGRLKEAAEQNEGIKDFFAVRDDFHKTLNEGRAENLEDRLRASKDARESHHWRWVNSRGESALYSAARGWNYEAWALLRASGFVYATNQEREDAGVYECEDGFPRAIGRHFVELSGCHVQKLVARSRVYRAEGVDEARCGEKVDRYFRDIDREEYTSDILKCIQCDPSLEVIFDFSSEDIRCVQPLANHGSVWGLTDFRSNRIYVAAMETEEFDHSDVVSNLVHELAHKALAIVFENGGLPYKMGDVDVRDEYDIVVKKLSRDGSKRKADKIIRRALKNVHLVNHELVVRVPEMIVKYNERASGNNKTENGFIRLKRQAPELLEFYKRRVAPELRRYIGRNGSANAVVKSELLRTPSLLTSHYSEEIQVTESIDKARTSKHNHLPILKVSNLKLGVSHLKSSLAEVTFVDWTKYLSACEYFITALNRNEIKTLAIIWDEPEAEPYFCHRSKSSCRDDRCTAKIMEKVVHGAIMILPKEFPVALQEDISFGYLWNDLSSRTKTWMLEKKLKFCGRWVRLKDILSCSDGNQGVESVLEDFLVAEDLSILVDQENVQIGRPLRSLLKERGLELLRNHPKCYIPRSLRVCHVELNKDVFDARKSDVFFVMHANKSDLESVGIVEPCIWDGKNAPVGVRCFTLSGPLGPEIQEGAMRGVYWKLKDMSCKSDDGGKWNFVHFFELKGNRYVHLHSFNLNLEPGSCESGDKSQFSYLSLLERSEGDPAILIADAPGSGKSTFVNKTALQLRNRYPKCWIDVVELPLFESIIKNWKETDLTTKEKVRDCLYSLIKLGDSSLERKIFILFCETKMKFFIFFDGFDEICPNYKTMFTSFLKALVAGTNTKVCVATRRHESTDLEVTLKTVSYSFVPLVRGEQIKFINMEWNAALKCMPGEERQTKIRRIISCLHSHSNVETDTVRSELIGILTKIAEERADSLEELVNFAELAEELVKMGKSVVEGEGELTETPLHTWMSATVAFEDNFNLKKFNYLSELYKRFFDIKIELYSKEKAKAIECVAGDSMVARFKLSAHELLKKSSVFFFLEEKDFELKEGEKKDMLRIGLMEEKGDSTVFVHRTFGEYFFSLWLLERAKKKKVAEVWLSRVLLERKFEKVRQFIDSLLQSEYGRQSPGAEEGTGLEMSLLNRKAFSSEDRFVTSAQKCFYTCILECKEGILQYLAKCAGDNLVAVIFDRAGWDVKGLDIEIKERSRGSGWNAFSFCGECIRGFVRLEKSGVPYCETEYHKFLRKLLWLTREHRLIGDLNKFISEEGLCWTGFDYDWLWRGAEGKVNFKFFFEFLVKNKFLLGETLKRRMLDEKSEGLLVKSAIYAFELFVYLLESLIEEGDFANLILEEKNFLSAWTVLVQNLGAGEVRSMWSYIGGKLKSSEERRKFLLRKDVGSSSSLSTALFNSRHPNVVPFVWGLFMKEFDEFECKEHLFETTDGVNGSVSQCNKYGIFKWLSESSGEGFLDGGEVTRLLLSRDEGGKCYMLRFVYAMHPPLCLYHLQNLLLAGELGCEEILRNMSGQYGWLASSSFFNLSEWISTDVDFISFVRSECDKLLPSLESSSLVSGIRLDDEGTLLDFLDDKKVRIHGVRLEAYLVLLERQLMLEERFLGRGVLFARLKMDLWFVYNSFPWVVSRGDERVTTRSFLVPYFFAVLSKSLSREEIAQVLLHEVVQLGTAFHLSLRDFDWRERVDPRGFLALYDVARWSMGEDALWRVHSIGRRSLGDQKTVLESLLEKQDVGVFEYLKGGNPFAGGFQPRFSSAGGNPFAGGFQPRFSSAGRPGADWFRRPTPWGSFERTPMRFSSF